MDCRANRVAPPKYSWQLANKRSFYSVFSLKVVYSRVPSFLFWQQFSFLNLFLFSCHLYFILKWRLYLIPINRISLHDPALIKIRLILFSLMQMYSVFRFLMPIYIAFIILMQLGFIITGQQIFLRINRSLPDLFTGKIDKYF